MVPGGQAMKQIRCAGRLFALESGFTVELWATIESPLSSGLTEETFRGLP